MGTSVVGAAALDLDGLEVGVQVDLDPGPGQACGAVLACRGPAVVVAVAGAVLAGPRPAIVVAVAGAVLARPGAAVVAGGVVGAVGAGAGPVVEERGGGGGGHACRAAVAHRAGDPDAPMRSTSPAAGAAIHLLPSRIV